MIRLEVSFRARGLWDFIYFLHKCDVWSCDVWSSALTRQLAFWTFSHLPATSKSNPTLLLLLLDFLLPPLRFKVQSTALTRPFWTSSHLPSASKSNPPLFLAPFGLPPASPPSQSPIRHSCSPLLDFLTSPLHFKVQSAALSRSFWTSSHLLATSKSNLPLFLAPPRKKGGLQRNPPILIRQSQSANLIPAIPINQPNPPSANSTK